MSEITKGGSKFIGYDYKEIPVKSVQASMYIDGYRCFGWVLDENSPDLKSDNKNRILLKLKRDRRIINKTELTRLQQHFQACMDDIESLERSKASTATIVSLIIGIIGTAFMALSTFAVTNEPPLIGLCILFAIPGFIGWILPFFVYKAVLRHKEQKITPLTNKKHDEIYEICEKGSFMLEK